MKQLTNITRGNYCKTYIIWMVDTGIQSEGCGAGCRFRVRVAGYCLQ